MKCVLRTKVTWCKCGFQCVWPSQNAFTSLTKCTSYQGLTIWN